MLQLGMSIGIILSQYEKKIYKSSYMMMNAFIFLFMIVYIGAMIYLNVNESY